MNHEKWTLFEKKKLVRLLNKYSVDDYEAISRRLPNKTADDVKLMITTQLKRAKYKEKQWKEEEEARIRADDTPVIDKWLKVAAGLVDKEKLDFSTHLARVMNVIADFEKFPDPDPAAYKPDYRSIYRYLGALMEGKEVPEELRPLESAVMLEILHSLLDILSGADTAVQRHVMKWKYQLITAPKPNRDERMKCCRKVIGNDFTEFIRQHEETGEESDSDTSVEMLMDPFSDVTVGNRGDMSQVADTVVSVKRKRRGRPRKNRNETVSPDVVPSSAGSELNRETLRTGGKEIGRGRRKSSDRNTKEPVSGADDCNINPGGEISYRVEGRAGKYVQIKPSPADLTDKKELSELEKSKTIVVKRKEFTYRPPPKEPEVVLVMPPADKPIVMAKVPERHIRETKDGKYRPLSKVDDDMLIQRANVNEQFEISKDSSHKTSLSHEEILKKLNARIKKAENRYTLEDIQSAGKYKYKSKTAAKQSHGNIKVKLPVKSIDGNIQVKFPVANVGRSGNIHVQLSAAKVEENLRNPMRGTPDVNIDGPVAAGVKTMTVVPKNSARNIAAQKPRTVLNNPEAASILTAEKMSALPQNRLTEAPPMPVISSVSALGSASSASVDSESLEAWKDLVAVPTGQSVCLNRELASSYESVPVHKAAASAAELGNALLDEPETSGLDVKRPAASFGPVPVQLIAATQLKKYVELPSSGLAVSLAPEGSDVNVSRPENIAKMSLLASSPAVSVSSGASTRAIPSTESLTLTVPPTGQNASTALYTGPNTPASDTSNMLSAGPSNSALLSAGSDTSVIPASGEPKSAGITSSQAIRKHLREVLLSASISHGSESSAVPVSRTDQPTNDMSLNTSNEIAMEKQKKRKAFDICRYTAFVKGDESSRQSEKALKKPKLYSLNPFCVPISLLDISK